MRGGRVGPRRERRPCSTSCEDEANQRIVLRFKPWLAPYKVAVFPLLKNRPELVDKARSIFSHLSQHISTT
jgi:glycyl-tRNA synthetase